MNQLYLNVRIIRNRLVFNVEFSALARLLQKNALPFSLSLGALFLLHGLEAITLHCSVTDALEVIHSCEFEARGSKSKL